MEFEMATQYVGLCSVLVKYAVSEHGQVVPWVSSAIFQAAHTYLSSCSVVVQ